MGLPLLLLKFFWFSRLEVLLRLLLLRNEGATLASAFATKGITTVALFIPSGRRRRSILVCPILLAFITRSWAWIHLRLDRPRLNPNITSLSLKMSKEAMRRVGHFSKRTRIVILGVFHLIIKIYFSLFRGMIKDH